MIRIGILMAGASREREISFAGGRTVYDNLDKSIFQAIPIFVDSTGKFIELDWPFLYKGTIRDFFPPISVYPNPDYQYYQEHIDSKHYTESRSSIGKEIPITELASRIDFAFLALHGTHGEDGSIQGLLEWLNIPYSGSGVLGSAIGIDKLVQKELMEAAGFPVLPWAKVSTRNPQALEELAKVMPFPFVLKNPLQGSSIGTAIVKTPEALEAAFEKVCFRTKLSLSSWKQFSAHQKQSYIQNLSDIRYACGFPLCVINHLEHPVIQSPHLLENWIENNPMEQYIFQALDAPEAILVEKYIEATEFSVIVIENEQGVPIALPPTEIRKKTAIFDYRSKYLPGIANKITPINLPLEAIEEIALGAKKLMQLLQFQVYARIDGFMTSDGEIYFNDPNTTSGMLPSSFFFHQAAEVGLNPSQFLSYIIRSSLQARIRENRMVALRLEKIIQTLDESLAQTQQSTKQRKKIAVIMGGYSAERHISVESGRNVYEKLNGSGKYHVTPVFLRKNESINIEEGEPQEFSLYTMPPAILLKDNADDISEKIISLVQCPKIHPYIEKILHRTDSFLSRFRTNFSYFPQKISIQRLHTLADFVFIAIHGRPGEDGQLQIWLEKCAIPYNGSAPAAAALAMDKFLTNEKLQESGLLTAPHILIQKTDFEKNKELTIQNTLQNIPFPWIAKPVDEGCSAAVKKIQTLAEAQAYLETTFRYSSEISLKDRDILKISEREEFPRKSTVLIEKFLEKETDDCFLEITVGFVTHNQADGTCKYEFFSPSETLSESEVLSLEEKFLAGQGQNITPARFSTDPIKNKEIDSFVRTEIERCARVLQLSGYARIDAFVRIPRQGKPEVWIIEANTLPGMTPATCIFHQSALSGYSPLHLIEQIIQYGEDSFDYK